MDTIDWQHLLFQFDGRINRAKFWIGIVAVYAATWILFIIAAAANSSALWVIAAVGSLAAIWPYVAVQIKRWHDRDKAGWWVFIAFIPLIGTIWVLVECGFLPGTEGPNQYGVDPLGNPGYGI